MVSMCLNDILFFLFLSPKGKATYTSKKLEEKGGGSDKVNPGGASPCNALQAAVPLASALYEP